MNTALIDSTAVFHSVAERRRHRRHSVRIDAILHAGGKAQPTLIDDLSAGGAGLDTAIGVAANDTVELELADGRRLAGTVVWVISGSCGIEFARPLADDDVSRLAAAER